MFYLYKSGDKFKIAHKLLKQLSNGVNPSSLITNYQTEDYLS